MISQLIIIMMVIIMLFLINIHQVEIRLKNGWGMTFNIKIMTHMYVWGFLKCVWKVDGAKRRRAASEAILFSFKLLVFRMFHTRSLYHTATVITFSTHFGVGLLNLTAVPDVVPRSGTRSTLGVDGRQRSSLYDCLFTFILQLYSTV